MPEYRLIPLTGKSGKGKFVKVSPEDYERVAQYKWNAASRYARTKCLVDGGPRYYYLHKVVLFGFDDGDQHNVQVDHRDRDRLNCVRGNLRVCTSFQNSVNRTKRPGGTSVYKGVKRCSRTESWQAQIGLEGKSVYLGYFSDERAAARAYDACARYYFGEFACTNFPGDERLDVAEVKRQAKAARVKWLAQSPKGLL